MSLADRIRKLLGRGAAPGGTNGAGAAEGISCREAVTVIYEFLDGELDEASHERVRAHFEICNRCYPHLRLEESFRAVVRRACAGDSAPAELKESLKELLASADPE